jgi:hypothetical protein
MNTYTWFYVDAKRNCVSPFFDSEEEAVEWFNKVFDETQE